MLRRYGTAQSLADLGIQQMRGMQRLAWREEAAANRSPCHGLNQPLKGYRRVENNHRESRSWRISSAAENGSSTGSIDWSLRCISCMVGKSAISRNSVSK